MDAALPYILFPQSSNHLGVFYLFWVLLFLAINVVWDVRTAQTPTFHFATLTTKTSVVYAAATFASSLILLLSIIDPGIRSIAGDTVVPIVLAGLSGILQSVGSLCPYTPGKKNPQLDQV